MGTAGAFMAGAIVTVLLSSLIAKQIARGIGLAIREQVFYAQSFNASREQASLAESQRNSREHSYQLLMGWLADLERTIDEIYFSILSDDNDARERAKLILDQWPWETLRTPSEVASMSFYWSEAVRARIRDMSGQSAGFVNTYRRILRDKSAASDIEADDRDDAWGQRGQLLRAVDEIQTAVRASIGVPAT